jgi:hypothetical protein
MITICYKCGSGKVAPIERCSSCGNSPTNDDELALAFMLTEQFLPKNKLAEASHLIKNGERIELPPQIRTAVLAAIQSARAQQALLQRKQGLSLRGWGILASIAIFIFLIVHPWPHYQWSSFQNTVSSYQGFVSRFPFSDYTVSARERIRVLREPEVWSQAKAKDQIQAFRGYIRVYPDGKHLDEAKNRVAELADAKWELISKTHSKNEVVKFLKDYPETTKTSKAEERIVAIANENWIKIASSRSVSEINSFLFDYPETSMRQSAEQRIQELYDDWDWVREQDLLHHYERFAARHPNHAEKAWLDKRIIDLEVIQIAAGEYGQMPPAQPLSYGGSIVDVEIENRTDYELIVRYSGPDSKKLVIQKGARQIVSLPPGDYKVTASVTATNVRNYYGTDKMEGGRYSSSFYIQSGYGGFPSPTYRPNEK